MKKKSRARTLLGVFVFIAVIGFAFTLGIFFNPFQLLNSVSHARISENPELKKIYDVNFIMNEQPSGNTNIFLPAHTETSRAQADALAKTFGVTENFTETDENFSYSDASGTLIIDKLSQHLRFEAAEKTSVFKTEEINAIDKAAAFAKAHLGSFEYEDAEIIFASGVYEVNFIERLGNLKNYAFPTRFTLDAAGDVLTLDYYFPVYDRLSSSPIMSMADAFWELPADVASPDGSPKVDLQKCTLVYGYMDSIVQPCYLFEGEMPNADGTVKNFRCFVRAAQYE